MTERSPTFLSYAFRPFFLLNGLFAVAVVLLWVLLLHGHRPIAPADPILWHAHEMLVGFAMATMAGFIFTAVANWTGRPPVHGRTLMGLVMAWLCGRAAMAASGLLPLWLVAVVDLAFPLLLCLLVAREILAAGNRRNYPVVVITAVLLLFDLVYHLSAIGALPAAGRPALYLMAHTVVLLIVVIGGRVVPNFTANWLRARGHLRLPGNNATLDRLCVLATVLTGVAATFAPLGIATGAVAAIAAILHAARLCRWRGMATRAEPLLFMLHVAYAWLPVGYALTACAAFGWIFSPTAALHALTMGVVGTMVLAMITRVPLGHTGRPLHAARLTVLAYAVLTVGVVIRVLSPLMGSAWLHAIDLSAAGWVLAFAIFSWVYWPILTGPRVE